MGYRHRQAGQGMIASTPVTPTTQTPPGSRKVTNQWLDGRATSAGSRRDRPILRTWPACAGSGRRQRTSRVGEDSVRRSPRNYGLGSGQRTKATAMAVKQAASRSWRTVPPIVKSTNPGEFPHTPIPTQHRNIRSRRLNSLPSRGYRLVTTPTVFSIGAGG